MFSKSNFRLMAGGLVALAMACAANAATVSGNTAGWLKNATQAGAAPDGKSVDIAVHLSLKNLAELKKLATDVSSPASGHYGHYLSKQDFAARFAPAAADVNAVKALLENAGMKNVTVGPDGVFVSATATVAQLRKTFKVSQDLYNYQGRSLRANREAPTIPAALAGKVLFIDGLDDTTLLRKPMHQSAFLGKLVAPASVAKAASAATAKPSVTPPPVAAGLPSPFCNKYFGADAKVATLSTAADVYGAQIPWLNCGYTPQQIQAAYGLDKVASNGKGVTVAITDAYASPTLQYDSNRYANHYGLPRLVTGVNFSQIIPLGIYDVSPDEPCDPYGWWGEQSLDMAAVHGAAPGANILYVGARDCGVSLNVAFYNTVYQHLADVVTNSWSYNGEATNPGDLSAFDQAGMAAAAQGITVLFSSGDDGDLAAMNGVASGSFPATSSWVTGVGGTSLMLQDASGAKVEHGWGTYRAYLEDANVVNARHVTTSGLAQTSAFGYTFDDFAFYSGAGGGISLLETQPSYQAGVVSHVLATSLNLASGGVEILPKKQRVSPDIAMDADPYTGYLIGESFTIAGDPYADAGCVPTSDTTEYCEIGFGGTSLASPLMAAVVAVMNQKRIVNGEPMVGFANPLLYSVGSRGDGVTFNQPINQIIAPAEPLSVLRGYANDPTRIRVVTVNSVPFLINPAPYAILVCGLPVCEGINEVWNFTSLSSASVPPTGAGYNDVAGLGVPYVPKLINEE